MKAYLISTQTFFKENHIDYAMALDLDSDIKIFESYWDAWKEYEAIMKNIRENFSDHEIVLSTDDENHKVAFYNKYESVRYIVTLMKKEIF